MERLDQAGSNILRTKPALLSSIRVIPASWKRGSGRNRDSPTKVVLIPGHDGGARSNWFRAGADARGIRSGVGQAEHLREQHDHDSASGRRPVYGNQCQAEDAHRARVQRTRTSRFPEDPAGSIPTGYDVTAKAADTNIGIDQLRPMLQTLLEDRFKLKVHRETKEMPVYALIAAQERTETSGSQRGRLRASGPTNRRPPAAPGQLPPTPCGGFLRAPNLLQAGKVI